MNIRELDILGGMLSVILWAAVFGAMILTLGGVVMCFKMALRMISA